MSLTSKKVLFLIALVLLFVSAAWAMNIQGGFFKIGGYGMTIHKPVEESATSYWNTPRTVYWNTARIDLWDTARNTEVAE